MLSVSLLQAKVAEYRAVFTSFLCMLATNALSNNCQPNPTQFIVARADPD